MGRYYIITCKNYIIHPFEVECNTVIEMFMMPMSNMANLYQLAKMEKSAKAYFKNGSINCSFKGRNPVPFLL